MGSAFHLLCPRYGETLWSLCLLGYGNPLPFVTFSSEVNRKSQKKVPIIKSEEKCRGVPIHIENVESPQILQRCQQNSKQCRFGGPIYSGSKTRWRLYAVLHYSCIG